MVFLWVLGFVVATGWLSGSLRTAFFGWSAFAFGALIWLLGGLLALVSPLSYTPLMMGVWCGVAILIGGTGWIVRRVRPPRADLIEVAIALVVFVTISLVASGVRYAIGTYDATAQLFLAQHLAEGTFTEATRYNLGLWGIFLPMIHTPAFWLGDAFFLTVQPAFTITMLGTLAFLTGELIDTAGYATVRWVRWVGVALLVTTYFVVFLSGAIYSNTLAVAYYAPAVLLLWRSHMRGEPHLVLVALVLLMGFAFTRAEATVYVLPLVVVFLPSSRPTLRLWWCGLLPYGVLLEGWVVWLSLNISGESYILTPTRVILLLATVVLTVVFPLAGYIPVVRQRLLPRVGWIMVAALGLGVLGLVTLRPAHMMMSAYAMFVNVFVFGAIFWWGMTWWVVALTPTLLRTQPKTAHAYRITQTTISYVLITWSLSFLREPYRITWPDSANRMLSHLLPVLVCYVVLRAAPLVAQVITRRAVVPVPVDASSK
ncbi:MAG: hypothetical protein AAF125_04335 [Chloroflexota bacterium]